MKINPLNLNTAFNKSNQEFNACKKYLYYNIQIDIKVGTSYFKNQCSKSASSYPPSKYGQTLTSYDDLLTLINKQVNIFN